MKRARIRRIESTDEGVRGIMTVDGLACCLTIERPWLDNKPNVSCIPAGTYLCRRVHSPTFKKTFEVVDVPGRTHILFHSGNTMKQSKGCILPGSKFGELDGLAAVLSSGAAFAKLMAVMEGEEAFLLKITNDFEDEAF